MLVYALLVAACFIVATQGETFRPRPVTPAPTPKLDIYRTWYQKLDRNKDQRVTLDEYLRYTHPGERALRRQYYADANKRKEVDKPGLDFYEFQKAVRQNLKDVLSGKYNTFDIADTNKNGEITFAEKVAYNKARYGKVDPQHEYIYFENAIDKDRNGGISRKEYIDYIQRIFKVHERK